MKNHKWLVVLMLAYLPWFIAAWDKDKPAGSDPLRDGDDDLRANNAALETGFDQDHDFTTGSTQTGKHDQITFNDPLSSAPATVAASEGVLYTLDVSSKAELHFEDEDENTVQVTTAGSLNAGALANDSIDSAHYAAGSIDLEHMSANSTDSDQYVDGSIDAAHLAADIIDETKIADNGIDSEHYNDGSIDAAHLSSGAQTAGFNPTSFAGEESVTFANGFIMKWGNHTRVTDNDTVSFGTAFPNSCLTVVAGIGNATGSAADSPFVKTMSTTGFTIYLRSNATPARWIAVGY